ncbi:hypothetical protein OROMI_012425 [Orobanche minor]
MAQCTHPDIAFSINLLARFSFAPTIRHWNRVKHIFRYLKGSSDLGLFFPYTRESDIPKGIVEVKTTLTDHLSSSDIAAKHGSSTTRNANASKLTPYAENPNNTLVGFAAAGYLSDPHKGYFQTGYVFTIGNTAISWQSTKNTLVATFSNHTEIIALHESVRECIWLRSVIDHIRGTCGLESTTATPSCIFEDNVACIEQMKLGFTKGDNTKHIAPKFFYNQQP